MHINHLSLTNFRNYARLELSLPAEQPVVLYGDNLESLFDKAKKKKIDLSGLIIHYVLDPNQDYIFANA